MKHDRVAETSTTTGTGTLSLDGALTAYRGIVATLGDGNTERFLIINSTDPTEWEIADCTITDGSPDTLSRDTVEASSNAGGLVDFSPGTKYAILVTTAAEYNDFARLSGENEFTEQQTISKPSPADLLSFVNSGDLNQKAVFRHKGDGFQIVPTDESTGDWDWAHDFLYDYTNKRWNFDGAVRFEDGIYLGGTAAANLLDDHETGVYTATMTTSSSGSITLLSTEDALAYEKVGDWVHVHGEVTVDSVSSPVGRVELSLPFTCSDLSDNADRAVGPVAYNNVDLDTGYTQLNAFVYAGKANAWLEQSGSGQAQTYIGNGTAQIKAGDSMKISLSYRTA